MNVQSILRKIWNRRAKSQSNPMFLYYKRVAQINNNYLTGWMHHRHYKTDVVNTLVWSQWNSFCCLILISSDTQTIILKNMEEKEKKQRSYCAGCIYRFCLYPIIRFYTNNFTLPSIIFRWNNSFGWLEILSHWVTKLLKDLFVLFVTNK